MGQTLSEPVTTKETASCANSAVKVGSSCMQGWRINMEDAHTHLLAVPDDKQTAFFAVYDGHGGARVSQYAGINLHKKIVNQPSFKEGRMEEAIRRGFLELDVEMMTDEQTKEEMSGTTAVVVLIKDKQIVCGNVGDSRAVASVAGRAEPLSYDHKPANEIEARRIVAAGGWVEFNRVNGNLALSRALGDFIFKRNESKSPEEQIVTANPDIISTTMTYDHEFIVVACDGIWDVLSNQEVVDFCRDRLANGREPEVICEELLTRCLAPDCQMGGLGCDNMTVVLVCLLQDEPWPKYVERCARPRPACSDDDETTESATSESGTNLIGPPVTTLIGHPATTVSAEDNGSSTAGDENEQYSTPQPSPIQKVTGAVHPLSIAGTTTAINKHSPAAPAACSSSDDDDNASPPSEFSAHSAEDDGDQVPPHAPPPPPAANANSHPEPAAIASSQ